MKPVNDAITLENDDKTPENDAIITDIVPTTV